MCDHRDLHSFPTRRSSDLVEWLSMPDPTTAISALGAGEIDYLQNPAMDTYPVLKANPKVRFVTVDPTGKIGRASCRERCGYRWRSDEQKSNKAARGRDGWG